MPNDAFIRIEYKDTGYGMYSSVGIEFRLQLRDFLLNYISKSN